MLCYVNKNILSISYLLLYNEYRKVSDLMKLCGSNNNRLHMLASYIGEWFGKKDGTELNLNSLIKEYAREILKGRHAETISS